MASWPPFLPFLARRPTTGKIKRLDFSFDKCIDIINTVIMKTKSFIMRVSEEEFSELKKRAGKLGLNVSAYVRMKTLYEIEESRKAAKKGKK